MTTATATALAFTRERLTVALIDEVFPLLQQHYAEITAYPDIPLEPDWALYDQLDTGGVLRIFTVRIEGALVGYAVFLVRPNPHYSSSLQAVQDILFVHPAHRRGLVGLRLVQFCDEQLKAEGCQVVYQHVKLAHKALGVVAAHCGYRPIETIWAKRLDLPVDGKA